jgi:hypothetical protein
MALLQVARDWRKRARARGAEDRRNARSGAKAERRDESNGGSWGFLACAPSGLPAA